MGVGRNLSYQKELFYSTDVLQQHKTLPTGDDDLLVNAVAKGSNTEICLHKDAFTYTQAPETFTGWLNKKRRHLRSGFKYKLHHRVLLFLFALSGLVFYATGLVLLVNMFWLRLIVAVFVGSVLLKMLLTFKTYRKLKANDLLFFSPLFDVLYTLYLLFVFFLLLLKPKNNWN
jgi:cellulose synthase/poly-beta-1,6-N-acetylglucosamine synthase-like glycosyltransferase